MDILTATIFVFSLMILGYVLGCTSSCFECYRLRQENQRLKQMLEDMRRVEEFSFKTYCTMIREASRQPPKPSPGNKK